APDETKLRRLSFFATQRQPAWGAPFEEQLDLFGDIADGALPIVEQDLHADGLRVGPQELRLRASLALHVSRRNVPLRAFSDRVLGRIELEFQAPRPAAFLETGLHHLQRAAHRAFVLLSSEKSVVGKLERLSGRLVVA